MITTLARSWLTRRGDVVIPCGTDRLVERRYAPAMRVLEEELVEREKVG